jgi:hypothetical protein
MKSSGFVSAALVSAIAILIPFSASHSFERSAWFDPYSILIYNADVANAHWLGECDSGLANLNVWKRNLSGAARQLGFQWMGDLGLTNLLVSFDAEGWDSLGYGCPYDVMQDFKPRGMFRYLDAQRIQYFIAETQLNSEHGPCCWNIGGYRTGIAGEIANVFMEG